MNKTCETCAFYVRNREHDINGECRRFPTVWPTEFDNGEVGLICYRAQWCYPPVDQDEWCGEWRKKEDIKKEDEENE